MGNKIKVKGHNPEKDLLFGMSPRETARRQKLRQCGDCGACVPAAHGYCVWKLGSLMHNHKPTKSGLRMRTDTLPRGTVVMEVHDVAPHDLDEKTGEKDRALCALEVQAAAMKLATVMPVVFYDAQTRFKTLAGPGPLVDLLAISEPDWMADKVEVTAEETMVVGYDADGREIPREEPSAPPVLRVVH